MRPTIWGSVAVTALLLVGASYLPHAGAGRAAFGWGAKTTARADAWVRAGGPARTARTVASEAARRATIVTAALGRTAVNASVEAEWLAVTLRREPAARLRVAGAATATVLVLLTAGARARSRRRGTPQRMVRRLARAGETSARIARRTRLAQDAVRVLTTGPGLARRRLG